MAGRTDETIQLLSGAATPDGEHRRWVAANIDRGATSTFMGLRIAGGVCRTIEPLLRSVEATLTPLGTAQTLGITSVSGYQGPDFHGWHSWGLALDVNYVTNPYIMHESGEQEVDNQLRPVFHRISRFLIISHPNHPTQDSIIPRLGGSVTVPRDAYLALKVESEAMKHYFALMQDGAALQTYLNSPAGQTGYSRAFASGATRGAPATPDAAFVQRQMEQDWTVLTSRNPMPPIVPANPSALVPHPTIFHSAPRISPGLDRPFDGPASQGSPLLAGRSPLNGYLDLSDDVVNAMVSAGFMWGAVGMGSESGDIMHFDARNLTSLRFADGKTIGQLARAMTAWANAHRAAHA